MSRTIEYTQVLETTVCWCGINYAVPANLLRHAHNDGQTIYCPLGHSVHWTETEAMRLKKKLDQAEALAASRLARIDQERASHAATKGQLTKVRKRAANGVCPCCNRSFVNVARHVKTQHPDHIAEVNA
jgi:hypothetical protein